MSWRNKVVWSEGLFLRPQHFQQETRYLEHFVETRSGSLRPFAWGFTDIKIDLDLLRIGKVGISSASGVLPDGTPFDIPREDGSPTPLDLDENTRDTVVYLALPVRRQGSQDTAVEGDAEAMARHVVRDYEGRDGTTAGDSTALLQVGSLNTRLLLEGDERADYACVGIARIVEVRSDRQVVVDDSHLPPVLNVQALRRLSGFITEIQGLLHHRGEALAGRVSQSGKGGAAEIGDFLMLQMVNRYEPILAHLATIGDLHPETLYRMLVGIAGELATFTSPNQRPDQMPTYKHDDLKGCFEPLMRMLRDSLSMVLEQTAVPIPLKERQFGIHVGALADPSLLDQATFVLAVSASMPVEELQARLPSQIKIGAVESIRDLVNAALPGIPIRVLGAAPRQIPFHAGNTYFELDRNSEHWRALKNSGGFALHVGGEFPDLQLEFWAIRG
jgi:type VI secretion system protein ImpJ